MDKSLQVMAMYLLTHIGLIFFMYPTDIIESLSVGSFSLLTLFSFFSFFSKCRLALCLSFDGSAGCISFLRYQPPLFAQHVRFHRRVHVLRLHSSLYSVQTPQGDVGQHFAAPLISDLHLRPTFDVRAKHGFPVSISVHYNNRYSECYLVDV